MRVLFLNHGALGTMLGHVRVEASLRAGMASRPDVDARFVSLGDWGLPARAFAHRFGGDWDLEPLRWHLAESARGRRALRRELRAFRPDAVHLHTQTLALLVPDVMRTTPCFVSVDVAVRDWSAIGRADDRIPAGLRPSLALERRCFGAAAGVVAWSEWSEHAVRAASPGARVGAIHPGLDLAAIRPPAARTPGPPRVLFVGGRFRAKGGDDLLAALDPWLRVGGRLDVVTKEPPAPRDGVVVHDLGPEDPRLADLLQQADVLCLPTHEDAYPWVLLEAMASGTPVVSTTVAAIGDLVPPGAGTLVAPGDVPALRQALRTLLADADLRARMGAAGRAHVEARFDARGAAAALMAFMRSAPHPARGR